MGTSLNSGAGKASNELPASALESELDTMWGDEL
jgi:hypothetical protein